MAEVSDKDVLDALLTEHRTYRAEVRMFDIGCVIAAWAGYLSTAACVAFDNGNVWAWWIALGSILFFFRSWGSLGEKFTILRANAKDVRYVLRPNLRGDGTRPFRHDIGEVKSKWRALCDWLFFGGGVLCAVLTILLTFTS